MDLRPSWDYIQQIAFVRLSNNKTDLHVYSYGDSIEALGVAGEVAARRWLGLPELVHQNFDGGVDLMWRGIKVDVKATVLTTKLQFRFLQWPHWKPVKSEVILLTAVDLGRKKATIVGYAFRDEVLNAPINHERDIPCHEIPVPDLHPAWELFTLVPKDKAYKRS